RDAVEVFDQHLPQIQLEYIGDDAHGDAVSLARLNERDDLIVVSPRQRDDDVIDALLCQRCFEILDAAQALDATEIDARLSGIVVKVADGDIALIAAGDHGAKDGTPDITAADDQHTLNADAALAQAGVDHAADDARRRQQHN